MAQLIERVCQAYADGDLSETVTFEGLLPNQHSGCSCCWRNMPKLSSYREDVRCQVCDMICMTLPPVQIMQLHNVEEFNPGSKAPYISRENRFRIARLRDRKNFQSNLVACLARYLKKVEHRSVMCPPDYMQEGSALSYSKVVYAECQYLTSKGANMKAPKFREALIEYEVEPEDDCVQSINNKRIIFLETYIELKKIGFDIHEQ